MSLADLTNVYLTIGTPSRLREREQWKAAARSGAKNIYPVLGEKGVGRLSAMRLGQRLRVQTARATDSHWNVHTGRGSERILT